MHVFLESARDATYRTAQNITCANLITSTPTCALLLYVLSVYRSGGMGALFVGSTARIAWLVPFTTIYLGIYEASKRRMLAYKSREL
jgi:hypothetical protein